MRLVPERRLRPWRFCGPRDCRGSRHHRGQGRSQLCFDIAIEGFAIHCARYDAHKLLAITHLFGWLTHYRKDPQWNL